MKTGNTHNLYAVILAGGAGTRFWPLSRQSKPKQFLNLIGQRTLFEDTLYRIKGKISPSHTFIVTNARYQREIKKQSSPFRIPSTNILLEPQGKNTAPAICWAASLITKKNPNAILAVLPSDHLILKKNAFAKALNRAVATAKKGHLVTFGIVPTRPETGYGYIATAKNAKFKRKDRKGSLRSSRLPSAAFAVTQFTEKPSLKKAKQFVRNGNYLWNSGMFVWKGAVILEEFKKYLPKVYRLFRKHTSQAAVRKVWKRLPNISIDYGILEKSKRVAAVKARNIGWSDLGSWEALFEVLKKDKKKNILKGNILPIDCQSTLINSSHRFVAAIGLKDMIVVDTPDALLIARRDASQKVRKAADIFQ